MTEIAKTGNGLKLTAEACLEIQKCLDENKHELPKGRIEQLKKDVAKVVSEETQTPALTKQITEFDELCKKYITQIHCLYDARDLARWEHYTVKMDLCKEVIKLAGCDDHDLPRIARELKLVRLRWKDIGSVPHEKNDEIWEEFCGECNKLQNRITKYYDGIEENRHKIAFEKIKICEEAEAIQSSTEWEDSAIKFKELQKKWREVGFTAPDQEKDLYLRFRAACDVFFEARKEFYHHAKFERDNVSSVKFQLCEEAKNIFKLSYGDAHQIIPDLWNRWKAAGSAGKDDRELYERFRACFDTYYDGLREQRNKNLKIKSKICNELESFYKSLESGEKQFDEINAEYSKIKEHWNSTGSMPRAKEQAILENHSHLIKKIDSFASKTKYNNKDILKRSFELEQIVSVALDSLDSKKIETWEKCRAEWKAAQSEEKIYFHDSFEAITIAFKNDSAKHYEELLEAFKDNLKQRRKICKELENLGGESKKETTKEDLAKELTMAIAENFGNGSSEQDIDLKNKQKNKIAKRWLKAGNVPAKNLSHLYKRFEQAMENI